MVLQLQDYGLPGQRGDLGEEVLARAGRVVVQGPVPRHQVHRPGEPVAEAVHQAARGPWEFAHISYCEVLYHELYAHVPQRRREQLPELRHPALVVEVIVPGRDRVAEGCDRELPMSQRRRHLRAERLACRVILRQRDAQQPVAALRTRLRPHVADTALRGGGAGGGPAGGAGPGGHCQP